MRWCAAAGFAPRIVQEAIEVPTLLSLVAAGLGVFLPIRFFERVSLPGVTYRPVAGAPIIDIVAVWRGRTTTRWCGPFWRWRGKCWFRNG